MVNKMAGADKKSGVLGAGEAEKPFRGGLAMRLGTLINDFPSRQEAADVAGVVPDQLARYIRGDARPTFETVANLAAARGFSLDWVASGHGEPRQGVAPQGGDEIQQIPVWDVVASSGPGTYHISERLQGHLGFSRAWLLTLNIPLNNLHVVFNAGDSNAPSINDRDAMLIHRGEERLVGDAFYLFDSGGVLLVKEIERRVDGSVVLKSKNPEHAPQVIPRNQVETLSVFGRVMWAGGTV